MFVTGSDVVRSVTGETYTNQELGGAEIHSAASGVAHRRFSNEKDCFKLLRNLIEILPASCSKQEDSVAQFVDKTVPDVDEILPSISQKQYDIRGIIGGLVDDNSFIEIADGFAKSIVVGFAKISGKTIGIVANQPLVANGVLTCDSSDKAARLVRFCDSFNVPIITFVDTPGYLPGKEQEHSGIIRHGAKLLFAYSEATVPKITIIVRKAYGGAYIAMGSKHMRADYIYALENAEVAVMGASGAAAILYKKELSQIENDKMRQAFLHEKADEYQREFLHVRIAQKEGFVDEVVSFQDLRRRIFCDLDALKHKAAVFAIDKKHGNMPL
jgi:propionyl-CoA carboxylase beta chain